jgi:hypothetical protein
MSSAQTWALIGTLIGILLASVAATTALVLRLIDAQIAGLRNELLARLDALDRDLQRLYARVFEHEGPPAP